jgi:Zn-dependent M28 family amino/carboxypeptidase
MTGFGVAAILGAAQALVRSGLRPVRTLRFVLFTGEEEGLLGSRAYVRQHAAELGNIVAVFALDWGAGPVIKLPTAGHPELIPLLRKKLAIASTVIALADAQDIPRDISHPPKQRPR